MGVRGCFYFPFTALPWLGVRACQSAEHFVKEWYINKVLTMNIFIHRKSKIKKLLIIFYASFVIFTSVFMKYPVFVHASSDEDSPVGDYITNIIGNSNFARSVLYRDMAHGFSVNTHGQDYNNFIDGYSNGIGGRFQKYCVDVLGFDENDVKMVTPIIQYSIDRSGGGASHSFGDRIVGAPIKGIMYTYERLIEGFCKWDAEQYAMQKNNDINMSDASDSEIIKGLESAINAYYDSFPIKRQYINPYLGGGYKELTQKCHCDLSGSGIGGSYGKIVAIVFPPVTSNSKVERSYDGYWTISPNCYILTEDNVGRIWRFDIKRNYVISNNPYTSKINLSNDNTSNIYCSPTVATTNNITNYNNILPVPPTIINNIFNTVNYNEGDTLRNTDNLYSDEFSLNYNRINGLYYIPIKVDTSKLTDEQKKNCPCEIVSLPQGDYLMMPITQDIYHLPDLNILKQLTDNNYCTQQDFTNQFRSIMNYTVINKDGDVYNYNNETVSKDTYYNEVNEYNKENYIPNGTDLTKIFPFCLPFDISRLLTPFNAEPVTPKFVVNFSNFNSNFKFSDSSGSSDTRSGSTGGGCMDINFDTLKIDELAKLLRTGEIVLFTISLAIWFFKAVTK